MGTGPVWGRCLIRMSTRWIQKGRFMGRNSEEIVYQKLKNAITKRYIRQGCKLVETALAQQLSVSRTPVRGAIKRLVYDGYATYVPNKGACVIEPTPLEIQETFFVRAQLEKAAAGLAATRITPPDLDALNRYLEQEITVFEKRDLEAYYVINDAIHLLIARVAGNQVMEKYIEELLNRTRIYLILYDPFFTMPFNPSSHEHRRIVEALAQGDSTLAEKVMDVHMTSAYKGMEIESPVPDDYISL